MTQASAAAIREGLLRARWTLSDLWIATLGIGGAFSSADVVAIIDDRREATAAEHNILAAALNDYFTGEGHDHPVPYWRDL